MEPVTVIAAISALMAALGVWQKERDYLMTRREFGRVYQEALQSPEIRAEAKTLAALLPQGTIDILGDRVERCWNEFDSKIDPNRGNMGDPAQAEPELEQCICNELRSMKRLNGTIPPGKFREWWNHYGCGPYIA